MGRGLGPKASCNPLHAHRPGWIFKSARVQLVVSVDGKWLLENSPLCSSEVKKEKGKEHLRQ